MTPDRIKISKEFHINGQGEWLSIEYPLSPEDDPIEGFRTARALLIEGAKTAFLPTDFRTGESAPYSSSMPVINKAAEKVEIAIDNATNEQDLNNLYEKAVEYQLTDLWDKKHSELINR